MNLHHFLYFDPTKKSPKKKLKFQWHSLLAALHKKSAHAHNVFFGFCFWPSLERKVDENKNSNSKITSPIICPLSQNFQLQWDTIMHNHIGFKDPRLTHDILLKPVFE